VSGAPVLPALPAKPAPAPYVQPAQQLGPQQPVAPAMSTPVSPQPMQQLVPTPMPPNSTGVPLSSAPTAPVVRMAAAAVPGPRVL
jgi:hypothetical protein